MANKDPKNNDSLSDQLSGLQFGPSWARSGDAKKKDYSSHKGDARGGDAKGKGRRGASGGGGRDRRGGAGGGGDRRDFKRRDDRAPRRPQIEPTAGLSCKVQPCKKAVEAIGQQIQKTGHTFPLYTLAKFVLGDRARYVFFFESAETGPELFRGKLKPALVLTKAEASAQLWQNDLLSEFYEAEEVETEAPAGNFPSVAKCGFSGTLLGPPNHHSYQSSVAKLHRERFANLTLDRYKSRIETVTDEESIEQWRAQMSKKTVYRTKAVEGQEPTEFEDEAAVERHFNENHFDAAFETGRRFVIPGDISATSVSPGILEWIKRTSADARKKPAALIPTLCSVLTGQRIAVFKWDGKLHSGPSRPHALPLDSKIADGPTALLDLIGENQGIELAAIVEKITGKPSDDAEAEPQRKRVLSDLHWLLAEGYALLLEGGQLFVPKKPVKDRPKEEQEAMLKSQEAQAEVDKKTSPEAPADAKAEAKVSEEASEQAPEDESKA